MDSGFASKDTKHEAGLSYFKKNPIIPNITLYDLFKVMNLFNGDYNAINCLNTTITYHDFLQLVDILAKSFKSIGISQGDIVTISMPNYLQGVAMFFALNKIGAIVSFLNSKSSFDEISDYLNEFSSPVYINFGMKLEELKKIYDKTHVKTIVSLTEDFYENEKYLSFEQLVKLSSSYNLNCSYKGNKNRDALIQFTSGSTGKPKMVVLTNKNVVSSAIYMKNSALVDLKCGEKCLVCVPFNYPYGFVTSTLMSLFCGREAILAPDLSVQNISKYIMKNPNYIFGIPPIYHSMMNDKTIQQMDLSSIKYAISGGDFFPVSDNVNLMEFFRNHNSSAVVCNGSGNAETSGANTNAVGIPYNPFSVGKPLVGTKVKVIDPVSCEELKYGEVGLLCVSGNHVFDRYYNNKAETEKVKIFDKSGVCWYKTDTYVKLTLDGYMEIVGRERRFFITFAEDGEPYKVYCNYVQEAIDSIDFVDSCVIVAKDDSLRGKVPYAYVTLKGNYDKGSVSCIIDIIKQRMIEKLIVGENEIQLKKYEIPCEIEVIDFLPHNDADKIDYILLEELANKSSKTLKKI